LGKANQSVEKVEKEAFGKELLHANGILQKRNMVDVPPNLVLSSPRMNVKSHHL
jgi:hypothetical protein